MRSWYIIQEYVEHKCEFVSVNVLKQHLWLKLNGRTFKVEYNFKTDYEYAKRGEPTHGHAIKKNTHKLIKFVFK